MDAGWLTVEEARDAMALDTGTSWDIRKRWTGATLRTAILRCPAQRKLKCRAKITLHMRREDMGRYRVDGFKSVFEHNGHIPGTRKRTMPLEPPPPGKLLRLAEDEDEDEEEEDDEGATERHPLEYDNGDDDEEYADEPTHVDPAYVAATLAGVEGMDCEQIRHLFTTELQGLTPMAYMNPEYKLKRQGFPQDVNFRRYFRRSVFKRVTTVESVDAFGQALRECERPYFAWWSTFFAGDDTSPLVLLRVHGVSSIEVERSLMRLQKRYACLTRGDVRHSGHTRHAVFTCPMDPQHSALLAINLHALRCYRMLSVDSVAVNSAMPVSPLLIQFWGLRATSPIESAAERRFGMLSVLLFIQRTLGIKRVDFETHGYGLLEPGFEIYDWLPEFVALFHDTDDVFRSRMYDSMHLKDPDQCKFTNLLAAFVCQKHAHYISSKTILKLHEQFMDGRNSRQLRARCPKAWIVIRHVFERRFRHGTKKGWVLLDFDYKNNNANNPTAAEERLPLPSCYYIYRLILVDGIDLLSREFRFDICARIILQNIYQPRSEFQRSVVYHDTLGLNHYYQALARPSTDPIRSRLRPFSINTHHLWQLDPLFNMLRALDYHRQRAAVPRFLFADRKPPSHPSVVDGPLRVDSADFMQQYLNLPVAHTVPNEILVDEESPTLAYLDDTLWVWGSGAKGPITPLMEAILLVRDPAFYAIH